MSTVFKVGDLVKMKSGVSQVDPAYLNKIYKVMEVGTQWHPYAANLNTIGIIVSGYIIHFNRDFFVHVPSAFYLDVVDE